MGLIPDGARDVPDVERGRGEERFRHIHATTLGEFGDAHPILLFEGAFEFCAAHHRNFFQQLLRGVEDIVVVQIVRDVLKLFVVLGGEGRRIFFAQVFVNRDAEPFFCLGFEKELDGGGVHVTAKERVGNLFDGFRDIFLRFPEDVRHFSLVDVERVDDEFFNHLRLEFDADGAERKTAVEEIAKFGGIRRQDEHGAGGHGVIRRQPFSVCGFQIGRPEQEQRRNVRLVFDDDFFVDLKIVDVEDEGFGFVEPVKAVDVFKSEAEGLSDFRIFSRAFAGAHVHACEHLLEIPDQFQTFQFLHHDSSHYLYQTLSHSDISFVSLL